MTKQDLIEIEGTVTECISRRTFRVDLDNGFNVFAYISPKRGIHVRISSGNRVKVELTPDDFTKGRITYRLRTKK